MSYQTIQLAIDGMKCGGCVDQVCKGLQALSGVKRVNVDLKVGETVPGKGEVEFDASVVGPDGLIAEVKRLGFSARVLEQA